MTFTRSPVAIGLLGLNSTYQCWSENRLAPIPARDALHVEALLSSFFQDGLDALLVDRLQGFGRHFQRDLPVQGRNVKLLLLEIPLKPSVRFLIGRGDTIAGLWAFARNVVFASHGAPPISTSWVVFRTSSTGWTENYTVPKIDSRIIGLLPSICS